MLSYNDGVYFALSTDEKPVKGVRNGDVLFEIDNFGKSDVPYIFMFDKANAVWYPKKGSGD